MRLWACGRGDVTTTSFGSHPNPISTRGSRSCPPYTCVHTKFWKPQARLAIETTVHNGTKVISKLNGIVRFSRPLLPSLFYWRELLLWYHELSWVDLVLGFFHKWRHYFLGGKGVSNCEKNWWHKRIKKWWHGGSKG